MLIEILRQIADFGRAFLIFAIIAWAWGYRRHPQATKILGFYLCLNLSIQLLAVALWQRSMNNLPLLHLQTLIEWLFFTSFFNWLYVDVHFLKKHFNKILLAGSVLLVANSLFYEPLTSFNSNAKGAVQIIVIAYTMLYFFDAYGRVDFDKTYNRIILLICFAILINYAGSLFIFSFSQFIPAQNEGIYDPLWLVNSCLSTLFQFIVMIAYWRLARIK